MASTCPHHSLAGRDAHARVYWWRRLHGRASAGFATRLVQRGARLWPAAARVPDGNQRQLRAQRHCVTALHCTCGCGVSRSNCVIVSPLRAPPLSPTPLHHTHGGSGAAQRLCAPTIGGRLPAAANGAGWLSAARAGSVHHHHRFRQLPTRRAPRAAACGEECGRHGHLRVR